MLKFQKIRYRNFLSSGNYWTEIDFQKTSSTLIIGKNGAGKSTMLDALTFSLFNKPFRKINKSQLVNTVNEKDCLVEVYFSIGKDEYKVSRGIKPNIFTVNKNGKILDELASSNDQQKWLEQNVLKLNYKSFTQIVILGSSSFVPFMQLSSQNRREVVEDLLDIKIFSTMNDITKANLKMLREQVRELEYKKENIKDKIDTQNSFIEEIKKRNAEDVNDKELKLEELDKDLLKVNKLNLKINKEIENKTKELEEYQNSSSKLKKLESIKIKLLQKIKDISETHSFFEDNNVCPTCTQQIEDDFRLNKIADIQDKKNELENACNELGENISKESENEKAFLELTKVINKFNNELTSNNVKILELEKQKKNLQQEIQKLTVRNSEVNIENDKLERLKGSLEQVISEIADKKDEMLNYEFIHNLLKDGGAKTSIIRKYLPVINKNLNKYLDILEFSINFSLDEEFNEKALNPIYEDFSYDSFSEGEKMRIDLALLFTWREIAKLKNSVNTNLLILDEVFDSSLDDYGTDNFTKIIRYVIKDSNVFIISHKTEELEDKFDRTLVFEKQRGFGILIDN